MIGQGQTRESGEIASVATTFLGTYTVSPNFTVVLNNTVLLSCTVVALYTVIAPYFNVNQAALKLSSWSR